MYLPKLSIRKLFIVALIVALSMTVSAQLGELTGLVVLIPGLALCGSISRCRGRFCRFSRQVFMFYSLASMFGVALFTGILGYFSAAYFGPSNGGTWVIRPGPMASAVFGAAYVSVFGIGVCACIWLVLRSLPLCCGESHIAR